ncbi:hypothetical protein IAT40_007990 [Kwoniella sp. CBS 6097]
MLRPLTKLGFAVLCLANGVFAAEEPEDSIAGMIEKTVPLRTHSLAAPYVDSDLQNRWWDFGGNTIINTNKQVRLTQDRPSETGWLWSRMPLGVANWQIDVEFKVDGRAHNMFGDGFAIWVAKDRAKVGPVFGSVDYFTGLGIFFDTYSNARHSYQWPRVTAMLGDGRTSYDHEHDNEAHEIGGCSENFRRRGEVPTKARLTYIKGKKFQLKLQTKKVGDWMTCFEFDSPLPDSPYIGFSAATGDVSDNHDIISINTFSATLRPQFRDAAQAPVSAGAAGRGTSGKGRPAGKTSGSGGAAGWFMFILKGIGILAFIAFAIAAFRTWSAQKKQKRHW